VFVHTCIMQLRFVITISHKNKEQCITPYQDNTNMMRIFSCYMLENRKIWQLSDKRPCNLFSIDPHARLCKPGDSTQNPH